MLIDLQKHHLNFPMIELENVECNPSVHFLDLIKDYHLHVH